MIIINLYHKWDSEYDEYQKADDDHNCEVIRLLRYPESQLVHNLIRLFMI